MGEGDLLRPEFGDRREDIFRDDQDRACFLTTLAEACAKTGWLVDAYCLMRNHFHLVVERPHPGLVAGMKWLLSTYTSRFNRWHQMVGHLSHEGESGQILLFPRMGLPPTAERGDGGPTAQAAQQAVAVRPQATPLFRCASCCPSSNVWPVRRSRRSDLIAGSESAATRLPASCARLQT